MHGVTPRYPSRCPGVPACGAGEFGNAPRRPVTEKATLTPFANQNARLRCRALRERLGNREFEIW